MSTLVPIEKIIDICSDEQLKLIFEPVVDLPDSYTRAELVAYCFNKELGSYGLKTYVSPDKTSVFIDDEGMCKVLDFFKGKAYQPVLTSEHTERVGLIVQFAKKFGVDLLWSPNGLKKKYYYLKQYGFNGLSLYHVLKVNTVNSAAAALSPVGATSLTIGGAVALSWAGSLFFSTLENYIPNNMTTTKMVVTGAKFAVALPIRVVEWTVNIGLGFFENLAGVEKLPINITETYRLSEGPKLENIASIKKPLLEWLLKKYNN